MKRELITEASVEALIKNIDEEDRRSLSVYTHMMLKAFAKKEGYKIALIFDNDESSGIAAINMTTEEVMYALASAQTHMYEIITQDMPSKDRFN